MRLIQKYKDISVGVKAGLWFTLCNLVQRGISFITMPIFTRIMTQNGYGMFSTYTSWYSFLLIFASLNLSSFVFNKGMVKYAEDRDKFQASMQSLGSVCTLILFIIYLLFENVFNQYTGLNKTLMLCMFIHMFFEPSILLWTARQRFEYKYVNVILVTLGIAVLSLALGIIAVKCGSNELFDRVVANTLVPLAFGLALYIYTLIKSKKVAITKYWKYALVFNLPLIPHFLSTTILNQADRIMITDLCGAEETALYSVAYALGMVTTLFSTAIQQALLPWLYTKLKDKSYDGIKKVSHITLMIIYVICILLIVAAPEIMLILAPSSYEGAVWVIPPVCGSVFFVFLYNLFANIEYYFEETRYVGIASIAAAVLNCILNYVFIKMFGFVAAGYTTLFCYIALSIMHYLCMKKICKKHDFTIELFDMKLVLAMSVSFVIVILLLVFLYEYAIVRYTILASCIGSAILFRKKILNVIYQMRGK